MRGHCGYSGAEAMLVAAATQGHNSPLRGMLDKTGRPVRLTLSYSLHGVVLLLVETIKTIKSN